MKVVFSIEKNHVLWLASVDRLRQSFLKYCVKI